MRSDILQVDSLTKTFRRRHGASITAVDGISFSIVPGEIVGLLGPNGAGKTTTIKCILGLIKPTGGSIRISGHDTLYERAAAAVHTSAMLEGSRNIYWRMTPRENVRFFAGIHGLDYPTHSGVFEELLHRSTLDEVADEPVMNLSTGMKQKVAVVCVLAKGADLVFLDEPTLGLDVETSYELRRVLTQLGKEMGRTFVVSSHDLDVIGDICERVIILKEGRIVADDALASLLDVFRTRRYLVRLADPLAETTRIRLAEIASYVTYTRGAVPPEVSFTLDSPSRLYEVIDIMRSDGVIIETITQREPDLREAFLDIIARGRGV